MLHAADAVRQWFASPLSRRRMRLTSLRVGSSVHFGAVEAAHLSRARFKVTGRWEYRFEGETLTAWELAGRDDFIVYLIIADEEAEPYLAVSRRLSFDEREQLLEPHTLNALLLKPGMRFLDCRPDVSGMKGWTGARYAKTIDRLAGKKTLAAGMSSQGKASALRYTLLLDETQRHALEVEQHDDGHVDVYATVFLPGECIERLVAPRSRSLPSSPAEPVPAEAMVAALAEEPKLRFPTLERHSPALPAVPSAERWVACDMRVAARLIEEAGRRQMPLADVLRRVLDLPLEVSDQVMLPFSLQESEYRRLAQRYGLDASDREAIRARMMEELHDFAGTS